MLLCLFLSFPTFPLLSFPTKRTGSPIKDVGEESSVFSFSCVRKKQHWIPAFAGMTDSGYVHVYDNQDAIP